MDELKLLFEVVKSMPAQVTGFISMAAIVYMMILRKRGVDITEKTSVMQNQIALMEALSKQNRDLQHQLIDVQNSLNSQIDKLSQQVSALKAQIAHYERKCDSCPGPGFIPVIGVTT